MIFRRENTPERAEPRRDRRRRRGDRRADRRDAQQRARAERPVVARRQGARRYLAPSDTSWDLAEDKLWVVPAEGAASRASSPRRSTAPSASTRGPPTASRLCSAAQRARARRRLPGRGRDRGRPPIASGDWSGRDGVGLRRRQARRRRSSARRTRPARCTSSISRPARRRRSRARTRRRRSSRSRSSRRSPGRARTASRSKGMLWLPDDYKPGTKLPLLLSVHGGPAGAWDVVVPRHQPRLHQPRLGRARAERARQQLLRRRAPARQHEGHRRRRLPGPDDRRRQARSPTASPTPNQPRDPRLELRRHPRRVDPYTNFTIQSGVAGGHGRRLGV